MRSALILGAGVSGFLHALAFRSAGIPIEAVYDPDVDRAELLAGLVGGTATDSLAHLASSGASFAAVCSPPIFHVEQAELLARPQRLLFVEKPVALEEGELDRLRALPNVVPVLQWRAGRAARELRAALSGDAFGPSPRLRVQLRLWRDAAYFAHGRRGRERWGCGAMLSIGIHAIDLLLFVVGRRVIGASGREWRGRQDIDVATRGELTVLFDGGARADLHITLDDDRANEVSIRAYGPSAFAGITATEGDPTASPLFAEGVAPALLARADGASGSPLLVPFVHEAVAAFDSGRLMISVDDVATAHALAFRVSSRETCRTPDPSRSGRAPAGPRP